MESGQRLELLPEGMAHGVETRHKVCRKILIVVKGTLTVEVEEREVANHAKRTVSWSFVFMGRVEEIT